MYEFFYEMSHSTPDTVDSISYVLFCLKKYPRPLVRFSSNFQESFVMVSFIPHCVNEILSAKQNNSTNRGAAPQASYDRGMHQNCFQTRPAQAFPKKVNISGGQRSVDAIKLGCHP